MIRLVLSRKLGSSHRCISPLLTNDLIGQRHQNIQSYEQNKRWVTNSATKTFEMPEAMKYDLQHAVNEAERIVGYPTSFLSLRWLLSDEIANMAMYLRKLAGSSHPLLKTSKHLMYNSKNSVQIWGLVVLLISKAAGHDISTVPALDQDNICGVLHSQRGLAELSEMIRIGQLVHNSLVNLQKSTEVAQDTITYEDMAFGNKISLLIGDYLLSESSLGLGKLRNQDVTGLMSSAIRDFSESEFIGERDEQNNPLPSKPGLQPMQNTDTVSLVDFEDIDNLAPLKISLAMGIAEKEWEARNILNGGSLLGKSCNASMKLAKQTKELQKKAYLFGKHFHLAIQAGVDAEPFQSTSLPLDTKFSLVSATVLFHLEYDHKLYDEIEKGRVSINNVDYVKIHKAILQGPGIDKTKQMQRRHVAAALQVLQSFPENSARTTLEKIVKGIDD